MSPAPDFQFSDTLPQERTRERKRNWNRANADKKREWDKAKRPPKQLRPFAGFDGEGWQSEDGKHSLFLVRAGDVELYTGKPLGTWEVFEWLVELPRDRLYVGYALGYDLTMILRGLPRERFTRLHDRAKRHRESERFQALPVDWAIFRMDWIPGKRFSVWLRDDPKKRFDVEDVVGCFQQTFATAIDAWKVSSIGDDSEQAFIERMKGLRSGFTELAQSAEGVAEIRRYNALECVLLERMMEKVREACRVQEIRPTSWYGAGQLAQAILRKKGTKEYMAKPEGRFFTAADSAYYGGFFDCSEVGVFPEMYEYDIASAYPHAMRMLPCLAHAAIRAGDHGGRVLYRVRWEPVGSPEWGAFPIRHARGERMLRFDIPPHTFLEGLKEPAFTPGTLYYPTHGQGWYWDAEVSAVERRGEYKVERLDAFSVVRCCDCEPFAWVPELYEYRKKLGKSGQGMVLKLGMNSLYGKLAQSVGKPQFANVVWAGMITSQTRGMIHDAIRAAGPDNVVMVATDAVYSKRRIEGLRLGNGLGDWESKDFGEYLVIVPGLHYAGDESKVRTRGIPARIIRENVSRIKSVWYSPHRWEPITFPVETFVSCQNAYHVGKPELRGEWKVLPRSIHFGSIDKREIPLDTLEGDSVRLPLWPNTRRLASGHRTEWDYAVAVARRREAESGLPEWRSCAADQPDYCDPLAFGE